MSWISGNGWKGNLLALIAGALTPLALAPFDFWPIAPLSLLLLYLGLRDTSARGSLARGWCYGFGAFATGTSWIYVSIHDYGGASMPLASLLMLGFTAGVALFYALPLWAWAKWFRRDNHPLRDALGFAAAWFALEWFRSWFLTGFPWLYVGYSQLDGPLAGLAPVGGVWLVSFVLALSAALLANLPRLSRRTPALLLALVLLLGPWIAGLALRGHDWTHPSGAPLSVAALQGNVPQEMKWNPDHANATLALYRRLTEQQGPTDLIVWPETAVPVLKEYAGQYLALIDQLARQRNAALITGVPVRERTTDGHNRFYNGITVVGQGSGTYYKQRLVPFGEYVPLQEWLRGLITFFDLPMSDFARGPDNQELLQANGHRLASFICYEVVYPELAARYAARSDLLLTVSNDTWFGTSIGPRQHLQMAQMRALESGRWMIRGTNNGVTALVDPHGRISSEIPAFQVGVLHGQVTPMQGLTPYLQWRLWPLGILAVLIGGMMLMTSRERRIFR